MSLNNIYNIKDEGGFTFIETLIALVLMSLLAVVFLMAVVTATKGTAQADYRTQAESLAFDQMEAIKAAVYVSASYYDPDGVVASYTFTQPSNSCYMFGPLNNAIPQELVTDKIYGIPWNLNSNPPSASNTDTGIQQITIIVQFNGTPVFTLVDFVSN
jgi:type II secretory pathway pseudopilin PulG